MIKIKAEIPHGMKCSLRIGELEKTLDSARLYLNWMKAVFTMLKLISAHPHVRRMRRSSTGSSSPCRFLSAGYPRLLMLFRADGMMIFARILQRWNLKSAERQARTA